MSKTEGPSRQIKVIGASVALVFGAIVLAVVLLGGGDDSDATADQFAGTSNEYGEINVIGTALPTYGDTASDPAVGLVAPVIEGFSVDGTPVDTFPNGRPKMIVFLAHWCPHCQAEVPRVQEWIDEGNLPDDIEVWGIATNTNKGQPNYPPSSWLEREGWTENLLMDDQAYTTAAAFGLSGFPFWVIVDGDGNVVARSSGQTEIAQIELWALSLTATS